MPKINNNNVSIIQITILNLTNPFIHFSSSSTSSSSSSLDLNIHDQIDAVVSRVNLASMLFGIVGNLICICVFNYNKILLKKRFNWYLLMLACVDCIFCCVVFSNYLVFTLYRQQRALYDLSSLTCYCTDFVVNSVDEYSVLLTLLLSIDRLYAIRRPINIKLFVTYRYQKQVTAFGFALITLVSLPYFLLSQRSYVIPTHMEKPIKNLSNNNSSQHIGEYMAVTVEPFCKYELFAESWVSN
jgi:hypothetical protein